MSKLWAYIKGFFSKQVITDVSRKNPYMVRWNWQLPFGLGTVKLHQILRSDNDRCQHNHPWWFIRIILWGGYEEVYGADNRTQVLLPWRPWAPWRIYYCPIDFRHRISRLLTDQSWSLVITGPARQRWGFFTKLGFMPWRKFVDELRELRVAWCEDGSSIEVPEVADA